MATLTDTITSPHVCCAHNHNLSRLGLGCWVVWDEESVCTLSSSPIFALSFSKRPLTTLAGCIGEGRVLT
jgi:hypothetical protein